MRNPRAFLQHTSRSIITPKLGGAFPRGARGGCVVVVVDSLLIKFFQVSGAGC